MEATDKEAATAAISATFATSLVAGASSPPATTSTATSTTTSISTSIGQKFGGSAAAKEDVVFNWDSLFGKSIIGKDGAPVDANIALKGKVVGIYFSSLRREHALEVTLKLIEFYNMKKAKGDNDFEVVFVSSDKDEAAFNSYYGAMPWLALSYADPMTKKSLSSKFKVIPFNLPLVILSCDGSVNTKNGHHMLEKKPNEFPWPPMTLIQDIDNSFTGKDASSSSSSAAAFCRISPSATATASSLKASHAENEKRGPYRGPGRYNEFMKKEIAAIQERKPSINYTEAFNQAKRRWDTVSSPNPVFSSSSSSVGLEPSYNSELDNDILDMASHGCTAEVEKLLENGANPNANGFTLRLDSGRKSKPKHRQCFQIRQGHTPLHKASENGHIAVVRLLCEKGADMNVKTWQGESALHSASKRGRVNKRGNMDVIEFLLEKGADVDYQFVIECCEITGDDNEFALSVLDRCDFTRDTRHRHGYTPLHHASENGYLPLARAILDKGALLEARYNSYEDFTETPLQLAVLNGHVEMASLLVEVGADVNTKGDNGETPLHKACRYDHVDIVRLLIANGANPYTKLEGDGNTPLGHTRYAKCKFNKAILEAIDRWPVIMSIILLKELEIFHHIDVTMIDLWEYIGIRREDNNYYDSYNPPNPGDERKPPRK